MTAAWRRARDRGPDERERATRQVAVAADRRQSDSAREAFKQLYDSRSTTPPGGAEPGGVRVQAHHPDEPAAGRPPDD